MHNLGSFMLSLAQQNKKKTVELTYEQAKDIRANLSNQIAHQVEALRDRQKQAVDESTNMTYY